MGYKPEEDSRPNHTNIAMYSTKEELKFKRNAILKLSAAIIKNTKVLNKPNSVEITSRDIVQEATSIANKIWTENSKR